MKENDEIKDDESYAIRPQTPEEKERLNTDDDIPEYRIRMDLDAEQEKRLTEQFFLEFEALEAERKELKLEEKWAERDAQYDGEMAPNDAIPFNLHMHQSKIKVDAIARAAKEAIFDVEGLVDVTPRPEMRRKDGQKVAERQAEFLDYIVDEEVKPEIAYDKIIKSTAKKFVGIGKMCWSYRREKRKREETYEGLEGLQQFLQTYPETQDPTTKEFQRHKGLIRRLIAEKKVQLVVNYKDVIDNNPDLKHIKVEDFYVRNACNYWQGLRTEHCIAERQEYTYWELLKKQKEEEFKNVEELWSDPNEDPEKPGGGENKDFMTKSYCVLEATMYFKLKEEDEEEVKIKAWFGKDKKTFLGAILYPYYAFDVDYIPHYMVINDKGFYGNAESIMYDMRDTNIALDALLNLYLYSIYVRHIVTPIVEEGSQIEQAFMEKTWRVGDPLVVDDLTDDVNKKVNFVQWPNADMSSGMALMEILRRDQSDVTKVSDLTSGRESTLDPTAPASKTLALLEQSGLGIKEYLRTFIPSFNIFCTMLLQICYQMNQEGREYRVRRKAEGVTGTNPFVSISRDEMIAKTSVQARASAFVFDKINEKREAMAGLNIVSTNPYTMRQPKVQYEALLIALKSLGGSWNILADKMPSPEQFEQQQLGVAVQALQSLFQQAQQKQQLTGVPSEGPTMDEAKDTITKAQAVDYNPALAEPVKK